MMHTLAVVAALSTFAPAQTGLTLSNDRLLYGDLGQVRPDNKLLPGDVFYVAFDIEGLPINEKGQVTYIMAMEVVDAAGMSIFKQAPAKQEGDLQLGGTKLPARAFIVTPFQQKPGRYTLKLTVTDEGGKVKKPLDKDFEVVTPTFGFVRLLTTSDPEGAWPIAPVGVVGQSFWLHTTIAHYQRDKTSKQPQVVCEVRFRDEAGQLVGGKTPLTYDSTNKVINEELIGFPIPVPVGMNRAGKYTIELTATDKIAGKTAKTSVPITVLPANK